MKFIKRFALVAVLFVFCLTIASCSNATQKYADKVNKAAENDKAYTYDKVMKDLGKEAIDCTVEALGYRAGVVFAAKGVKTKEDLQKKTDNGEKIEGITIVIANGKAVSASFGVIDPSQGK